MAKITYLPPIKSVSGKLAKKDKVVYMVRRAATSNEEMLANPYYSSTCGVRSTPYSDSEKAAQARFGKICMKTNERLNDAEKQAADTAAFKAQSTYSTLRQFVWHEVAKEIN